MTELQQPAATQPATDATENSRAELLTLADKLGFARAEAERSRGHVSRTAAQMADRALTKALGRVPAELRPSEDELKAAEDQGRTRFNRPGIGIR